MDLRAALTAGKINKEQFDLEMNKLIEQEKTS
jgi:hypothetical protein